MGRTTRVALGAKRVLDVVGAAGGLLLLSPVVALTALAVWAVHGRPILFRQRRAGLRGRPFWIVKFRTMRLPRPGEVWHATDEQRLTPLGRFLRTTSLDEIPELWNVLRGDMSLVGPRPLLVEFLADYTEREQRRHDMRPGVTGWAAVHGRNAVPFRRRLELDVWYVERWSLWLDVKVLLMTAYQVLRRSGASATEDDRALGFPVVRHAPDPDGPSGAFGAAGARRDRGPRAVGTNGNSPGGR